MLFVDLLNLELERHKPKTRRLEDSESSHDSNPVNKKKINALKSNQPKREKIDRNSSQLYDMIYDLITEEGAVNKKGVVTAEQGGVNSSFVFIDQFKVR